MELIIITGLSGSGKSRVKSIFSDFGFRCVDNMPPELFGEFIRIARRDGEERVVLTADVRSSRGKIAELTEFIRANGAKVVYLEASPEYITRRYKETRRGHPLETETDGLETATEKERELLAPLKEIASLVMDTTNLSSGELTRRLAPAFAGEREGMRVEIRSFAFKRGIPADADMVFDARFIKNPFYEPELRPMTGLDKPLADYVLSFPETREFLDKLRGLLRFLIPEYSGEGRPKLVIAVGCTGGRHRSVALAEELGKTLGVPNLTVTHRESPWEEQIQ